MFKIIGKANGVARPHGWLDVNGDQVPIISATTESILGGAPPLCSINLPAEYIQDLMSTADDTLYRVYVADGSSGGGALIFTGYLGGQTMLKSAQSYGTGITLIHQARDLDQTRLVAPDIACGGYADNRVLRYAGVSGGTNMGLALFNQIFYSPGQGPLASQIIQGLISLLQKFSGSAYADIGSKKTPIAFEKCIKLLQSITVLNGTISSEIDTVLKENNGINHFLHDRFLQGFNSMSSIWDILTMVLSNFGLYMICAYNGTVYVTADLTNLTPPDANTLDSSIITDYSFSSTIVRNIKNVTIVSYLGCPADDGTNNIAPSTIVEYPPSESQSSQGATLLQRLPAWLEPMGMAVNQVDPSGAALPPTPSDPEPQAANPSTSMSGVDLRAANLQYAQMVYNYEINKMRTATVSFPLAPTLVPGTTVTVTPFSTVRAKSGPLPSNNLSFTACFYGLRHEISAQTKTCRTTLLLRNVSSTDENLNVETNPVYSDAKPFDLT